MADREKEEKYKRKKKIQKFEWNKKSFLDEIKNIFHSFWRAIIWWKIKIWEKIANTSFNKVLNFIPMNLWLLFQLLPSNLAVIFF